MGELTQKALDAVYQLNDEYRASFCLNNCRENNYLYILKEKGEQGTPLFLEDTVEEGDDEETLHMFLPIWNHTQYVEFYLQHANEDIKEKYEIVKLDLELFKTKWSASLKENKIALAVLPLEQEKDFCIAEADVFNKEPITPSTKAHS